MEILGGVLNKDPDISAAPARVHKLLRWCLEKDRKQRLQAIGDGRRLLSESAETSATTHLAPPPPSRLRRFTGIAAGVLALALTVALGALWRSTRPVDKPLLRLSVDLGPDAVSSAGITVAISPDGTRLVFPVLGKDGKQQLATRLLDQTAASVLPGTEAGFDPFFSPDGQWVGFFADSKMKKISVLGGAPVALCDAPSGRGATWGQDGNIIAALNWSFAGLSRIPAGGGTPQKLTATGAASGTTHRWPQILPGDEAVLFTVSSSLTNFQYATVDVLSPRTGERKTLVRDAISAGIFQMDVEVILFTFTTTPFLHRRSTPLSLRF